MPTQQDESISKSGRQAEKAWGPDFFIPDFGIASPEKLAEVEKWLDGAVRLGQEQGLGQLTLVIW